MMVVAIPTEPTFRSGRPVELFEGSFVSSRRGPGIGGNPYYDISPDGRFLMIKEEEGEPAHINVVLNWFEELKRLVPTN